MAKSILVYYRNSPPANFRNKFDKIASEIHPDNLSKRNHPVIINGNLGYTIVSPFSINVNHQNAFYLGTIFKNDSNWHEPLGPIPSGSFCLFRTNDHLIEACTDFAGSRNIWYYFDEEKFIVSTSQRAIVLWLGDFFLNDYALASMLSTGSIGWNNSWDSRIKKLSPFSIIRLHIHSWDINPIIHQASFNPQRHSIKISRQELEDAISYSFNELDLDFEKWILPLSGGYDSRAILLYLLQGKNSLSNLKSITWGGKENSMDKQGDIFIAKKLAEKYGIRNDYLATDFVTDKIETILSRFFVQGECQLDHVSGYLDGFNLWKNLSESNIHGIIRGDEGFGWKELGFSPTETSVRKSVNLNLCRDFKNIRTLFPDISSFHEIPEELKKLPHEDMGTYRDRLYHFYRIPTILSSLSDLKVGYIEICNPFLSKPILEMVRKLPTEYRTEKVLFKSLVDKKGETLPFAKYQSTSDENQLFKGKLFKQFMINEIEELSSTNILPKESLTYFINGLHKNIQDRKITAKKSFKKKFIKSLPIKLKETIKTHFLAQESNIDSNILAFRLVLLNLAISSVFKPKKDV